MRVLPRLLFLSIASLAFGLAAAENAAPKYFRVWIFADAHVDTDRKHGLESLATALRQSESESGFQWDIALDLGDLSGAQGTPKDEEGEEIVRQFSTLRQHRREQIYDLSGNHDRSGLDEGQAWWWRSQQGHQAPAKDVYVTRRNSMTQFVSHVLPASAE